jgi:hypothetical protein
MIARYNQVAELSLPNAANIFATVSIYKADAPDTLALDAATISRKGRKSFMLSTKLKMPKLLKTDSARMCLVRLVSNRPE